MFPTQSLVSGVKTDLEKLIKKFTETDSVRYELFAEIWRDMKMNFVCAGRQSEREAREFMEMVFELTTKMWFPPFPFQNRVCALYLLYGLYTTQPCHPRVKIRMLQSQWSEVKNFINTLEEQHHLDVNFILHKLRAMNAFYFVATKNEHYPKSKEFDSNPTNIKETMRHVEQSNIRDTVSAELLQQMEAIHTQYYSMKCLLAGPGAAQPDRSLNLLNDNIVMNVKTILQKFEGKRRAKYQHAAPASEEDTSESDLEQKVKASDSVGSKRKRIRDRAYEQVGKSSKFYTPDPVMPAAESGKKGKGKGKGKGKRTNRKARKKKSSSEMSDSEEESFLVNITSQENQDIPVESGIVLHMPTLVDEADNSPDMASSPAKHSPSAKIKTNKKPKAPVKQKKSVKVSPKVKISPSPKVKISPSRKVKISSSAKVKISPSAKVKISPSRKAAKIPSSSSQSKQSKISPKARKTKKKR